MSSNLDIRQKIVDEGGFPTLPFHIWWQEFSRNQDASNEALADQIAAIAGIDSSITGALSAAENAALVSSGTISCTLTGTDAGSNATISVSSHTRVYGDGSTVIVNQGSVLGLTYSTVYYVYYVQASREGGSVQYFATTSEHTAIQVNDVHFVGTIATPAAAASATSGTTIDPPGISGLPSLVAGTVISVAASGGATGLLFSGSPITTSGTLTLGGTLAVASGGTGAIIASTARTNLGAAASGANNDITSLSGITGSIGAPTYIQYGSGSGTTLTAGRMWYNETTGSMNVGMGGGNITQQVGEELFVYGKASATINDSPLQLVYQTGTVGASGSITFAPTVAGISDSNLIIGIATEPIANNAFGRITTFGIVRGITTTGAAYGETWADGDIIWYNPVTGNPTKVKPSAPNIKLSVGTIITAGSGGSGSIQVGFGHGSVLGGTDSNVQLTSAANNDLLQYSTSLGYWRNLAASSVSVGAATNLANGAANRIAYQTGVGATGFVVAPVSANTFLEWSGSAFQWSANPLGTVTSVALTVPTGLTVSGSPITSSGTLAVSLQSGYSIPTIASQSTWDTAYTDRLKWDGGSSGLVAATGRTSLGATTLGSNLFTLANPSAITFPRINADNSVSTLTASDFRTAIGAGTGSGSVTSVGTAGSVNGITLTGTVTTSGTLTLGGTLSGVNLSSQVTGTLPVANGGTGTTTAFTSGSVVFAGGSGVYSQDNANLFWDDANNLLKINGSTSVIIGPYAGSASYGAISLNGVYTAGGYNFTSSNGDQNLYINRPSGLAIHFRENNNTQAIIATGGAFGIGLTAPDATLHLSGIKGGYGRMSQSSPGGTSQDNLNLVAGTNGGGSDLWFSYGVTSANNFFIKGGVGSGTTGLNITSGNAVRVGTISALSAEMFTVAVSGDTNAIAAQNTESGRPTILTWNAATSGDNTFEQFYTEASPTIRGSITYNRAGGLVSYNVTSDYRAKDILGPVIGSGAMVDAIGVYNGRMKDATLERPMFMAHEVQEVAPYAVTGDKDAVDEAGSPAFQQIDHSSLIPLLVAEIQSLRARVAQLEG